jgi:hypothetical protein
VSSASGRGESGTGAEGSSPSARALERDRLVVERCIAGDSLLTIGHDHGYVSPGPTLRFIDRAIESCLPQLDGRARHRLEGARLDRLLAAWWQPAVSGDSDAARLVLAILEARTRLLEPENGNS